MRGNILETILEHKKTEVETAQRRLPLDELQDRLQQSPAPKDFTATFRPGYVALIAEVKFKSPSAGIIRYNLSLAEMIGFYQKADAEAISILTDKRFFGGTPNYLAEARQLTSQPLLRKDFIIDCYQIYEARLLGADGVLLLARVLPPSRLYEFIGLTRELGMEALVECCTRREIREALAAGATIIGINNRDLGTFQVDLKTTLDLVGEIKNPNITIVSESGIRNRADVELLGTYGVDAVLVGGTLMSSPNIQKVAEELRGVPSLRQVASS